MKRILRHLLYWYLAGLARLLIWRFRPAVIAVAGTVNKTFAKEAVARILAQNGLKTEMAYNGFNTEIGLPLAILGLPSGYESYARWWVILGMAIHAFFQKKLSDVLILELGVSRPGDLKKLLRIVKPRAAIITDLTQRYRENFSDISAMAGEYGSLLAHLPPDGLAVLNYDTILVRELGARSAAPVFYVSLEPQARSENIWSVSRREKTVNGQTIVFQIPDGQITVLCERFGRHHAAALLIAEIIQRNFKI